MDPSAAWGLIGVLLGSGISIWYSWFSEERSTKKRINWELRQKTYLEMLRMTLKFVELLRVSTARLKAVVPGQGTIREQLRQEISLIDVEAMKVSLSVAASDKIFQEFQQLQPVLDSFLDSEKMARAFHGNPGNESFLELRNKCEKLSKRAEEIHVSLEKQVRKELGSKKK